MQGHSVQTGTVSGGIHIHQQSGSRPQTFWEAHAPWQLPPPTPLAGRAQALALLDRRHQEVAEQGHRTLTVVSGLGGVGKTALALTWLRGLRERYPGGLYADLGAQSSQGPADPTEILARFLRALGTPPASIPSGRTERASLYRELTEERRLVVLLDDAASAAQVRPLLPGGNSPTVVTSRWQLSGLALDGARTVQLEPITEDAAVELLAATLCDRRVDEQPDEARALVGLCAGLPLAVRVAGARLAARPARQLRTLVRQLTEEQDRLALLTIPSDDRSVQAALDLTYRELPPDAARLYRLLGLHPVGEFGNGAAEALLLRRDDPGAEDSSETAELLDLLHDASLLVDAEGERHRFHDLVRLHAAAKATETEPERERAAALRRLADHYLAGATRAEEIIDPQHRTMARDYGPGPLVVPDLGDGTGEDVDADTALEWLERELPNLMAVLLTAREAGFPTVAWQLADAMWPLFLRRKHYDHWRTAHAEGLEAAVETGDTPAQCRMLTSGGMGELGREPEAALSRFERAARLFEESGDELGRARTLNYRGRALQQLGRRDEAAEFFAQAAARLAACGDPRAGGLARFNHAQLALEEGRLREASEGARDAHAALGAAGDTYNEARAAALVGRVCLALGDEDATALREADAWLDRALTALRPVSDYETAHVLSALARLAESRNESDRARDRLREAAALYSTAGHPREAESVRDRLQRLRSQEAERSG